MLRPGPPASAFPGWLRVGGTAAMLGCLLLFCGSLLVRDGRGYVPFWDLVLGNLVLILPTLACLAAGLLGGPRRSAALLVGLGMASFTAGNIRYVGWTQFDPSPPVPAPADLGYLGIYPFLIAALLVLMRRTERRVSGTRWLDGALGAFGAATALAAVLDPVLARVGGQTGEALVGAAYPISDLLVIAIIGGLLAARGVDGDRVWLWLAGAMAIFCAGDVIYALRVASGRYEVGTLLDGVWAVAMVLMALAMWRPERPRTAPQDGSLLVLAVPLAATLVAVAVLVAGTRTPLTAPVVALATATLLLAAARTLVSFREVRRLSQESYRAVTDELTELGNRRRLFEGGEARLRGVAEGRRIALVLMDLDEFKEVNDTFGHHTGDALLRIVAWRLKARLQPTDLLVRLGGDEFALVVTLAPGEDPRERARALLGGVEVPVELEGARLQVRASVGVAETAGAATSIRELLRRADVAMYQAKRNGSGVEHFDARLDAANRDRAAMAADLEVAFAEGQFVLHYQPVTDAGTGALVGAEALVRWQHPTRGLLAPDAFLCQVQRNGQMTALTHVVLAAAISRIVGWRAAGLLDTVAVNLSVTDLLDCQIVERTSALLAAHDLPGSALALEITESDLMTDPDQAGVVLARLRALGVRIAVDDYGTGYSSLAYLQDLAIDELKIDRSFVSRVLTDSRSAAIVRSTIHLAHALDLGVVAEGVEDADVLEAVAAFGCDRAQGFLFSRPLPADAFAVWAREAGAPVLLAGAGEQAAATPG